MAAATRALRTAAVPWWGILAFDLLAAALGGVLIHQGILQISGVQWHTAAVVGFAAAESCAAFLGLVLVLRWRQSLNHPHSGWSAQAYEHFNAYLRTSHSPLDSGNVNAAAAMVVEVVDAQGRLGHLWHASIGMLLCVPALLSAFYAASRSELNRHSIATFLLPFGVTVCLSLLSLSFALLGIFIRRSGLALWKTDACDRRATEIEQGLSHKLPTSRVTDGVALEAASPSDAEPFAARAEGPLSPDNLHVHIPAAPLIDEDQPLGRDDSEESPWASVGDPPLQAKSERTTRIDAEPIPPETSRRRKRGNSMFDN
jgi:hypothetical protein